MQFELICSSKNITFCFSVVQTKIAAVENTYQEDQAKLNQKIQQLQRENTSLREEKMKLTKKMEELEGRLQQG